MQSTVPEHNTRNSIRTYSRNRYFYGKVLDVFHFEMEQEYLNGKRWLLNRLIAGYGVVCGLDVQAAPRRRAVVVTPGVALDRGGREIVVPRNSEPVEIPPRSTTTHANPHQSPPQQQPRYGDCEPEDYVHLCICFQQCDSDPAPVTVDDCGQPSECSASSIQERYKLVVRDCKAPEIDTDYGASDLVLNGRLSYHALVERVTRGCAELPADLCIPLANIRLPPGNDDVQAYDIDINPRPIVYSNDLLFDLVLALSGEAPAHNRGGKK